MGEGQELGGTQSSEFQAGDPLVRAGSSNQFTSGEAGASQEAW